MAQQSLIVRASNMVKFFMRQQKEAGVQETFNFTNAKWTMNDIMEQIDDDNRVRLLLQYFFLMSESKLWNDFQYNYDTYLERFEEARQNYARRLYLQQETIKRSKTNSEL